MLLRARDVMTPQILTVGASWTVEELVAFLSEHGISGAPVADDRDNIVGIVSVTDVARARIPERTLTKEQAELVERAVEERIGPDLLRSMHAVSSDTMTVGEIMTPMVFDVSEETPLAEVADVMLRGRIHRVLVRGDRGRLVGIVSSLDLLRVVRDHRIEA